MEQQFYLRSINPDGYHKIHYRQFGDPENKNILVCIHGLTRNAHDFDHIARSLSDIYRVVCLDLPGRGKSDWFTNKDLYRYYQYRSDIHTLITHLGVDKVDYLGTSLGGTIAIMMAGKDNHPFRKIIFNDISPYLDPKLLDAITEGTGSTPMFNSIDEIKEYLKTRYAAFGNLDDEHWNHIAQYTAGEKVNGKYRLAYDPAISYSVIDELGRNGMDIWDYWEQINVPSLVVHGLNSVVLSKEDAKRMHETGPKADILTIEDAGHAPPLMCDEHIEVVREWLLK